MRRAGGMMKSFARVESNPCLPGSCHLKCRIEQGINGSRSVELFKRTKMRLLPIIRGLMTTPVRQRLDPSHL